MTEREGWRSSWFLLLFTLQGYHFPPGMFWSTVILGALTALLCFLELHLKLFQIGLPLTLHGLLGFVVGLLLVFRTNSAYERWWEARKQLGALLNTCRFLATKLNIYLPAGDAEARNEARELLQAFVWSLVEQLRESPFEQSQKLLDPSLTADFDAAVSKPSYLLEVLGERIHRVFAEGRLAGEQLRVLEQGLKELTDILGACERIKGTPIPPAYTMHLRRIVMLYVVSLPVGLIRDFHWWSVPVVMAAFYIMAGIEFIGEEIEDPFGRDDNDLPVSRLAERAVRNVEGLLPSAAETSTP